MKRFKNLKKWSVSGFTLLELMVVMAVTVILGAVGVISAANILRNMRQAASDKVAESLYMAVTERLQEVWAFDYEKVETLGHASEAIGVSDDTVVIRYVSKDVGGVSGTDAEKLDIVLGEKGSAVGADYYRDSIIVEFNASSLQVNSVFYSSSVSPDKYYTASNKSLADLRSDVSKRKQEFNGYLGYYQAETHNLPELVKHEFGATVGLKSDYAGDPVRHLRNMDELTAPISIHIPNEEYENIKNLKFEISVTGKESNAVAKIVYDEQDASEGGILQNYAANMIRTSNKYDDAGMVTFEVVLDNLQEGNFNKQFCDASGDKKILVRFRGMTTGEDPKPVVRSCSLPFSLEGGLFIPGEDIEVKVSAIKVSDVKMTIKDEAYNIAIDNSIFACGSGKKTGETYYAAYLAYGRHLQNLSSDISGIGAGSVRGYQVQTIDFTKKGDWLWGEIYSISDSANPYYSIIPFSPIVNNHLMGLYGDYSLSYNAGMSALSASSLRDAGYVGETTHKINGLVIRSTEKKAVNDAGLFAAFSGNEIKNITLSNPRISGKDSAGGFIARLSMKNNESLTIKNCALFMTDEYCTSFFENSSPYGIVEKTGSNDPDIQDDSDAKGIWLSGENYAGGLIGEFIHDTSDKTPGSLPHLLITDSNASTVIDTTDSPGVSGGLIGFVGSEGDSGKVKVTLKKCYGDSYIYGADTGGLIGRIAASSTVKMYSCYTAGFQDGAIQSGLANGTINFVSSSYAFTQMNVTKNTSTFSTAADITNSDGKVYYFPQSKSNSGNAGNVNDDENTKNVEELSSPGETKTISELLLTALGSDFEADPGDTCPYNLRDGMALSIYSKPRLKSMVHYGDWEEDFTAGALCYYEKYVKAGSNVRFYGGNYNVLYNNLEHGEAVKADGYGLVFKKNDNTAPVPDSAKVKYYFAGGSTSDEEVIDLKTAEPLESEYEDETYLIYKLKNNYVNYPLAVDSREDFYTKVEVTYVKDGTETNTEVFYFNPHFARAVGYLGIKSGSSEINVPKLKPNGTIYVRSARHLYDMSLYYKFYRTSTEGRTFRQTYDISYTDYDWHGYFNSKIPEGSCIVRQNPIGLSQAESFMANYNGGCYKIRNISFVLESEKTSGTFYTGLFGTNEGNLSNIVLFADYDEKDVTVPNIGNFADTRKVNHYHVAKNAKVYHYAGSDEDINKNKKLYLGILAGMNCEEGNITNCAIAGYCMADTRGTIVGNTNGYIYAGGLVGENEGTVSDCSADTPQIKLTTNYTTVFIGGFSGRNSGTINNSYSLGHIEVVNPRGGSITLGGFAAINSGEISSAYCAEHIVSAGNTTVYAFAPNGGSIRKCNYLSNGTYSYVNHLYSYTYTGDVGAGTAKSRSDLVNEAGKTTHVKTGNTEDYPGYNKDNQDYPYRAVVKDIKNQYIHYGDWQKNPGMGEYGIFYWEKEEEGGNAGYHFSYTGVDPTNNAEFAGSTLCNAHDDKGIIVDYGYGYFVKKGNESSVTKSVTGLYVPNSHLIDVAGKLEIEVPDYTFYPYRTLKANSTDYDNYIYLNYSADQVISADNNTDICNGEWNLTKDGVTKTFYVAPFFANAMSLKDGNSSKLTASSQDGINETDYSIKPGKINDKKSNPYEIRTVEQLQYINWNAHTKKVSSIATSDPKVYKSFPYLAYASVTVKGIQKKADAGHNWQLTYLQTHDVSGLDINGNAVIPNYTPIAASQSANEAGPNYNATLYAWFGGSYKGESYKISNISISSPAFTVGVFGVTVSAVLDSIILYSDRNCVIERNNGTDMTIGGYNIGGLVGIAYKYADSTGFIYNCAVAGYKIKDQSTNQQTIGGGNVGGLVGATTVDVKNCSAVTDIEINCTHAHNPALYKCGHSEFGDYVRTGGLVGALPGAATNCYSGGTIRVSNATLSESRRQDGTVITKDEEEGAVCERKFSMNVYIGGIAGSAYTMNYHNFTDKLRPNDGSPTITNCYTYVDFPELRGSIRSITMIASLADRYCNDKESFKYTVFMTNCYYLGTFTQDKVANAAKYKIHSDGSNNATVSPYNALNDTNDFVYDNGTQADETLFKNMIRGGGAYVSLITGYVKSQNYRITNTLSTLPNGHTLDQDIRPTSLTYDQLSLKGNVTVYDNTTYGNIVEALNAGDNSDNSWGTVTTTQGSNNANIDGKYSFPGNHKELDGLNYPFPTIVTQRDLVFNRKVNVHYGVWPLSGMYWSEARAEMDIFGDQDNDGYAYKELEILESGNAELSVDDINNSMEVKEIVKAEKVTKIVDDDKYIVRFKALKTGTETIIVGTAMLIIEVKANLYVSTNPAEVTVAKGIDKDLKMIANATSTSDTPVVKDFSQKAKWTVTIRDNGSKHVGNLGSGVYKKTYGVGTDQCTVTGENPGKTQIVVKAVVEYNSVEYDSSLYLPLQTFGVIGLSNHGLGTTAGTNEFWNETSRALKDENSGKNVIDFGTNAPVMTEDGWTDLYLYESYADETLGRATITGISIGESAVSSVKDDGTSTTYTSGGYTIDIGSASARMSADENYRYRSLKIRPEPGKHGGDVSVKITLKDGETDASYVLSGKLFVTHVVTANANKPSNTNETPDLAWKALRADNGDQVVLKESGTSLLPALTGYKFDGWSESDNGPAVYCIGESNSENTILTSVLNDKIIYAKWTPIKYTVRFHHGDGSLKNQYDNLDDMSIDYDKSVTLYDKTSVNEKYTIPIEGRNFVGWNTKQNGSGISYKPGAVVKNLSAENGAVVTLFAQWRDKFILTFRDNKNGSGNRLRFEVPTGDNIFKIVNVKDLISDVKWSQWQGKYGYYWSSPKGATYRLVGWDTDRMQDADSVTYKIDGEINGSNPLSIPVDGDCTYYAIWEEQGYSITLMDSLCNRNKSYSISGSCCTLNDMSEYTMPTCPGYRFEGWYTDRIANGGEEFAGSDGIFKGGKKISKLLMNSDSITLYARYSETVYTKVTNLSTSGNYLIGMTELGKSVGDENKGKFAYLLTTRTEGYFYIGNNSGNKDLAGIDHAFNYSRDCFYRLESGGITNKIGSVCYMDTQSMPVVKNEVRYSSNPDTPINTDIPNDSIWIYDNTTRTIRPVEYDSDDDYLFVSSDAHLHATGATQADKQYKWFLDENGDNTYLRFSTNNKEYYLHSDYWNINVKSSGLPSTAKNNAVDFYRQTTVYLDEQPPKQLP